MKRYLLLVSLLFFLTNIYADTDVPGGNISGTWSAAGSPYHIMGDLTIPDGHVLRIEPGVKVIFHGYYGILVDMADLLAVGTAEDSILFTSADTSGFVNGAQDEGGWKGLRFFMTSSQSDSSRLSFCRFEFGKTPPGDRLWEGLISIENQPNLIISHCAFINNKPAEAIIDCLLSDVRIQHNCFRHNNATNILNSNQSNPVFSYNQVDSNQCVTVIEITEWSNGSYDQNILYRNNADGIIHVSGNSMPKILLNKILNNELTPDGYVLNMYKSRTLFINNLLANNSAGIELWDDSGKIVNNTIVNNSDNNSNPLILIHSTSNLFLGNLINGNSQTIGSDTDNENCVFRFNMIDFDTSTWTGSAFSGVYENNLNYSAHFVDPTADQGPAFDACLSDFNISPGPFTTNNGDPAFPEEYLTPDMFGRDRIRYGRIDIGAYETDIQHDTIPALIDSDTVFFADTLHVMQDILITDNVQLDISARAVVLFHGPFSINVEGSLTATGTEDEPILFTIKDTTGFASGDYETTGWKGIILDNRTGSMNDNRSSGFEYCIFEYGKNLIEYGGVFTLYDIDDFHLTHSEFRYNTSEEWGTVIFSKNSDFDIDSCIFHHNTTGNQTFTTIFLEESLNRVNNSVFHDNKAGSGTVIRATNCVLDLHSSHFYNNRNSEDCGTGTVLNAQGSTVRISNCLLNNNGNSGWGILQFQSSSATIANCTFTKNFCEPYIIHATIGLWRSDIDIYNSIFWGNGDTVSVGKIVAWDEYSDPNLYHCLVEAGMDGIWMSPFSYTGDFLNCIDTDPVFISPSQRYGPMEAGDTADWNLRDISPCIDAGTRIISGIDLPSEDLSGQTRILNGQIDLGVFEKSGNIPGIETKPVGGNYCAGDTIELSTWYSDTDSARLQWKKDGEDIMGAVSADISIYDAKTEHTGNYTCEISNSFGSVSTPAVFVNVNTPPEILTQPSDEWVLQDQLKTLSVSFQGSQPFNIQWIRDGKEIDGADSPEYRFTPVDSTMEGSYTCLITNMCGTGRSEPVLLYLAPQICMVTVSETSGNNLIIWEKKSIAPIMAYNVYRESSAAGIYDRLATIPYDDLSIFVDTIADPTVQAYLYKITAIDTAGNETDADLCKPHKTIHLLVSTNPELNTTQLEWDRYYGFDYGSYFILRSVDGSVFSQVHDMSSNLNSWTDPDPIEGELVYRIAVERPDPCYAEGGATKAGTGPYNHSLSNLDDNRLQAGQLPPDTITLTNSSIQEENLPATVIGKLITEDQDSIDAHTYQFVPGVGDTNNISFTLLGDLLLASESFDYETKDQYTVRIRSTDQAGNYCEVVFIIQIIDVDETTGLPVTDAGEVKVYPNPFSQSTTISFPNPAGRSYRMVLTDLSGKVCRIVEDIATSEYVLEKGDLKEGFYFIELRGNITLRGKLVVE